VRSDSVRFSHSRGLYLYITDARKWHLVYNTGYRELMLSAASAEAPAVPIGTGTAHFSVKIYCLIA